MKKQFTNWIAVKIALLPLLYLAIIWNSLPQIVPLHRGIDMQPDRMGDKSELWLACGIITAASILTFFLLKNIHRIDPKRKHVPPSTVFHKIAFGMVVFMAAINVLVIHSAKDAIFSPSLLFVLLGLLFAFIGNYMINIKPNYFAGFRLPWTLNNDENWRKTHQLGGKVWFIGGILVAIICPFLAPETALVVFLSVVVILVMIPVIYSYRIFKKQSSY